MERKRVYTPLLLFLVFFGPVLAAVLIYLGPQEWIPLSGAAHGELLDPVEPLPRIALRSASGDDPGRDSWSLWSLVYARRSACGPSCIEELNRLNQVRLALGDDRDRTRLVLLYAGRQPAIPAAAELLVGRLDEGQGVVAMQLLLRHGIESGRVFIVDPHGNLVVRYPAEPAQEEVLEDLERLIKLAVID